MQNKSKKEAIRIGVAIGSIGGFLAFAYLVLTLASEPSWIKSNQSEILFHGFYWFIILLIIWRYFTDEKQDFLSSPKIIEVRDDAIILTKFSPWLSVGVKTSVYIKENDFEKLTGAGEVINVQSNDLVQIRTESFSNETEYLNTLKADLKRIIIRPGLY